MEKRRERADVGRNHRAILRTAEKLVTDHVSRDKAAAVAGASGE